MAGNNPALSALPQDPAAAGRVRSGDPPDSGPGVAQNRLASWISDLTTLHGLIERLGRTPDLDAALREVLRAGAALVGAPRGLISLRTVAGLGADQLVSLGLGRSDLGHLETVPGCGFPAGRDRPRTGLPPEPVEAEHATVTHRDIARAEGLHPRHREVAARLGFAASHTVPLTAETVGQLGTAVWLYDEAAEPDPRQRHLLALYLRHAGQHLANRLELTRATAEVRAVYDGLLPERLPRLPGVALAVRHHGAPYGGAVFLDALALPDGALGLAMGGMTGSGPAATAATRRLRAGLRAYAVMEGEDPVAVLADLELLLRLTEPTDSATALFGYAEPATRKLTLATAGHPPPLVIGPDRVVFAETTPSAPLGMLACWEAPSIALDLARGETVLMYSAGLLHHGGEPLDAAFARLQATASAAAPEVRSDPDALVDHVLRTVLSAPAPAAHRTREARWPAATEDIALLAARL